MNIVVTISNINLVLIIKSGSVIREQRFISSSTYGNLAVNNS